MSLARFQIGDEAVGAMWDGLARELKDSALPCRLPDSVLEVARDHFLCVLSRLPENVLTGVVVSAGEAAPRLGLTVRDGFRRHLTGVAQDLMGGCVSH